MSHDGRAPPFGVPMMLKAFYRGQRALIYPGALSAPSAPLPPPRDASVLHRPLGGARVEAWLLPPLVVRDGPAPLLVFAHGNAETIHDWAHELEPYRRLGLAVLLPEYRGYGQSGGEPTEADLVSDVIHFVEQACARPDIDAGHVVFHGRSLGGGVLGGALARVAPRAFILESTFASLAEVARDLYLPGALLVDEYRTAAALVGYGGAALILHGRRDWLVRYRQAELLLAAAKNGRLAAFDCGHNDLPRDTRYWRTVSDFLALPSPVAP